MQRPRLSAAGVGRPTSAVAWSRLGFSDGGAKDVEVSAVGANHLMISQSYCLSLTRITPE